VIRWARQKPGRRPQGDPRTTLPTPRRDQPYGARVALLDGSYGRAFPPSHRTFDFGRGSGFDEGVAGEG
jgi:hypothetical protein